MPALHDAFRRLKGSFGDVSENLGLVSHFDVI